MSTQPITNHRQFEVVAPAELLQVRDLVSQQYRYRAIDEAVRYLAGQPVGSAVRVKVIAAYRLKRMRESAIGYGSRRGIRLSTKHLAGWLYIIRDAE